MGDESKVRETFLKDIATHQMQVLLDNGVHRHLKFRRPGTSVMGFDIVTWPGYLCISGDMGEYVFARLTDMLVFFRREGGALYINPGYWAEKCQAADRHGKVKEFSEDRFRAAVLEHLASFCAGGEEMHLEGLVDEVREDVFRSLGDGPNHAYDALMRVEHKGEPVFTDFWDRDCTEYTFHYLWICHAIAWAVIQYDQRALREAA